MAVDDGDAVGTLLGVLLLGLHFAGEDCAGALPLVAGAAHLTRPERQAGAGGGV